MKAKKIVKIIVVKRIPRVIDIRFEIISNNNKNSFLSELLKVLNEHT